jgi:hypothetical protein
MINASSYQRISLAVVAMGLLNACGVTARMEPYKQTNVVIEEGDQVVVLARKQHASHEAEEGFVDCVSSALARGRNGIDVYSTKDFEDTLYPWFEPSMAPLSTEELSELLDKPGVMDRVRDTGVRFLVWLDGSTERTSSGGGIS